MAPKSTLKFLLSALLLTPSTSMAVTLDCRFQKTKWFAGGNETFIYDSESKRLSVANGGTSFYQCTETPGVLTCLSDSFHSSIYQTLEEHEQEYTKMGFQINRATLEIEVRQREHPKNYIFTGGRGRCSVVKQQF